MALEKAKITRYDPVQSEEIGEVIEVLFNPGEYRLSQSNQFAEVAIPGLQAPPVQFVRGNVRTLSMQLFFDTYTYNHGEDVRKYTGEIIKLLNIDPDLHAPPVCKFAWGGLSFVGVLERAEQSFTMFLPNGIPVRATVDVTFKEFSTAKPDKNESADFTKYHQVHQGETLSGIAGEYYNDPTRWRPIAQANKMDDPLALRPGQMLVIPALR